MNAIVSVTSDWAIGNKGGLLVRNRDDMRRFVSLTRGSTVLMGRTTFESLPGGPLKGRRNVVVTHDAAYAQAHEGIECATSLGQACELVGRDEPDKVWLIGGESLYRALLGRCERACVTKNEVLAEADAFFPNLDEDPAWQVESVDGEGVTAEGVPYAFVTYRNLGAS